ncbi:MAG TPA: hypothetical protein VF201_00150 [Nitrolancea sp.]
MMHGIWPALFGATRYEFRMQLRRKSIWIATFLTSLLVFTGLRNPWNFRHDTTLSVVVAQWAVVCNAFLPIVFGVLLADRLPRDRRLHLPELLDALPAPSGSRLAGKYFGSALATAMPIFFIYFSGIIYSAFDRHDPVAIPLGLAAFLAINVPGLLFVAAFSIVMPAILWVPLYQFLFVGYWFWGNLLGPAYGIPTISTTWLTPIGGFAAAGFFSQAGEIMTMGGDAGSVWQGAGSIALLLASAALALFIAQRYLTWQHARQ